MDVRPQATGTIRAVHFKEGDEVKAGQLMFTLDASDGLAQGAVRRRAAARRAAASTSAFENFLPTFVEFFSRSATVRAMKKVGQLKGSGAGSPGAVIRAVRRSVDMTLVELSEKTGLAASTLSKLEAGHIALSYDKLSVISRGLGVDMAELLDGGATAPPPLTPGYRGRRVAQRAGEGKLMETRSYSQIFLATELLHKKMTPIIAEVHARTMEEFRAEFGDFIRHPGEEFIYVIEGEVEFCTELYEPTRLRAGDTLYFDSEMGHAYLKASDSPCRLVAATVPRSDDNAVIETFAPVASKLTEAPPALTAPKPRHSPRKK